MDAEFVKLLIKFKNIHLKTREYRKNSPHPNIRPMSYQCGMKFMTNLNQYVTPLDQLARLISGFNFTNIRTNGDCSQIIFTDNGRGIWGATKEVADKGPTTKNPNSGNAITVYIVTKDTLMSLIKKNKLDIKGIVAKYEQEIEEKRAEEVQRRNEIAAKKAKAFQLQFKKKRKELIKPILTKPLVRHHTPSFISIGDAAWD